MDVSASTSFESSPDKRNSIYVGDNTFYDSALDHQLSTTAYKSCNGKHPNLYKALKILSSRDPRTEGHVFQENHPFSSKAEKFQRSEKEVDLSTYGQDTDMDHKLTEMGNQSASFTNPEYIGESEEDEFPSRAIHEQKDLIDEHDQLDRKVNELKLKLVVLQIQTRHQKQTIENLKLQSSQKLSFSQSIKKTIMVAARESLQSQTPDTFPDHLISQIFAPFADDEKLNDHFKNMDYELKQIVQKMCRHAYESQKPFLKDTISEKIKKLKQRLIQKYEDQLDRQKKSQQRNALAMKQKCFDLLKQFLLTDCQDESCNEDYIKKLEALYEQEILKK